MSFAGGKVRTTVSLPKPVYDEARTFVEKSTGVTANMNSFFVSAIVAYVKLLKRKQIDAKFAGMADDKGYQRDASLMSEEFSPSDWLAFESVEKDG